jgi:hypothetical protein
MSETHWSSLGPVKANVCAFLKTSILFRKFEPSLFPALRVGHSTVVKAKDKGWGQSQVYLWQTFRGYTVKNKESLQGEVLGVRPVHSFSKLNRRKVR